MNHDYVGAGKTVPVAENRLRSILIQKKLRAESVIYACHVLSEGVGFVSDFYVDPKEASAQAWELYADDRAKAKDGRRSLSFEELVRKDAVNYSAMGHNVTEIPPAPNPVVRGPTPSGSCSGGSKRGSISDLV